MKKSEELIQKYHLKANSYYPKDFQPNYETSEKVKEYMNKLENNLRKKWRSHIPRGWYGFALGAPTPVSWFDAIDEFLDFVKECSPNFEIHNLKTKFGGIRIYLGNISENIQDQCYELEKVLCDTKLLY